MPCQSLFRKALPRKPLASVDAHTTTVIAQPMEPHAVSVASQITGFSNAEAPEGGTVHLVAHPLREGHKDRDAPVVTSQTKAKDEEEETSSRDLLPKGQAVAVAEEEESPSR